MVVDAVRELLTSKLQPPPPGSRVGPEGAAEAAFDKPKEVKMAAANAKAEMRLRVVRRVLLIPKSLILLIVLLRKTFQDPRVATGIEELTGVMFGAATPVRWAQLM